MINLWYIEKDTILSLKEILLYMASRRFFWDQTGNILKVQYS